MLEQRSAAHGYGRRYTVTADLKQHVFVQRGDGVDPASPEAREGAADGGAGGALTAGPNHAFQTNVHTIRSAIGLDPYESLSPEQVCRRRPGSRCV